jgi:hypothetical protein
MRQPARCLLIGCTVAVVLGCQTLATPVTETTVDQQLIAQPAPSPTPPEDVEDEPRSGFHQESPGAQ